MSNSIGQINPSLQTFGASSVNQASGVRRAGDGDGDGDGGRIRGPRGAGGPPPLMNAVFSALKNAGIDLSTLSNSNAGSGSSTQSASNSSTQTSSSSSADPAQVISQFMGTFMEALRSQNQVSGTSSGDATAQTNASSGAAQQTVSTATSTALAGSAAGASATSGHHHHHHHHGGGDTKIQSDIKSLANEISNSPTDGTVSKLNTAFSSMVTALGGDPSKVTLSSFVQSMSQGLGTSPPAGNVVNTTV